MVRQPPGLARAIRRCYERGLLERSGLAGQVLIRFTIAPSGLVAASRVASSTLGHPEVEECIVAVTLRWRFPPPRGGGLVNVNYPFNSPPAGSPGAPEPKRP